jgi:hypothetical protein
MESACAMQNRNLQTSPGRRNGRIFPGWLIWLAYFALFAIGIPWYWPEGSVKVWFGVPCWVVVAVAASAGVSLLTAALLYRPWPGEEGGDHALRQSEEDAW